MKSVNKKSSYLGSIVMLKCPHCREGKVFLNKNSYKKNNFLKMNESCPVCLQQLEVKKEFYYAPNFLSYVISIFLSVCTFVAWWLFIGFSVNDNGIFWWFAVNIVLILFLQPYILRLSRVTWLSFSMRYDSNWKQLKETLSQ
jgi:uncharacterized protein (DUF983 family)